MSMCIISSCIIRRGHLRWPEEWRWTKSPGQTRGPGSVGVWSLQGRLAASLYWSRQLLPGDLLCVAASLGSRLQLSLPFSPRSGHASCLGPRNRTVPLVSSSPARVSFLNFLHFQLHWAICFLPVPCWYKTPDKQPEREIWQGKVWSAEWYHYLFQRAVISSKGPMHQPSFSFCRWWLILIVSSDSKWFYYILEQQGCSVKTVLFFIIIVFFFKTLWRKWVYSRNYNFSL